MSTKTTLLNVLKIAIISIAAILVIYLLYGFVKGFFVNIDNYIGNSKKLNSITFT
jgi:hypothetical protein